MDSNQSLRKMGPSLDKNLSVLEVLDSFNFDKLEMILDQDCLQKLYEKLFKTSSSSSSSSPASSGGHRYCFTTIKKHTMFTIFFHEIINYLFTSKIFSAMLMMTS